MATPLRCWRPSSAAAGRARASWYVCLWRPPHVPAALPPALPCRAGQEDAASLPRRLPCCTQRQLALSTALQAVFAAGNDGIPLASYPAAYPSPSVISVASLDVDGRLSWYSNYGPQVHIASPGNEASRSQPAAGAAGGIGFLPGNWPAQR